jgi:cellulose biosynthesis protein BcsQ
MNTVTFFNTAEKVGSSTLIELLSVNIVNFFNLKCAIIDANKPEFSINKQRDKDLKDNTSNRLERMLINNTILDIVKVENAKELNHVLKELEKEKYDIVFLDIPKQIDGTTIEYLSYCNFIFIPLTLEEDQEKSSFNLFTTLKDVSTEFDSFKELYMIINKVKKDKADLKKCYKILENLEVKGAKVIDIPINFYKNYERSNTLEASLKTYQKNDQMLKALMFDFVEIVQIGEYKETEIVSEEDEEYFNH